MPGYDGTGPLGQGPGTGGGFGRCQTVDSQIFYRGRGCRNRGRYAGRQFVQPYVQTVSSDEICRMQDEIELLKNTVSMLQQELNKQEPNQKDL